MTNIGIIESNYILSRNYADFFEGLADYHISFQYASVKDLFHQTQQLQTTSVVILDIAGPDGSGLEAVHFIKKNSQSTKVIIFTSKKETTLVVDALKSGADSYLLKTDGLFELHKAIKEAIQGGLVMSPAVAKLFVNHIFSTKHHFVPLNFTTKENEIIRLVQEGLSYKEMADRLKVTPFTINHHLKNIYKKGGVNSRSQLMVMLQQQSVTL